MFLKPVEASSLAGQPRQCQRQRLQRDGQKRKSWGTPSGTATANSRELRDVATKRAAPMIPPPTSQLRLTSGNAATATPERMIELPLQYRGTAPPGEDVGQLADLSEISLDSVLSSTSSHPSTLNWLQVGAGPPATRPSCREQGNLELRRLDGPHTSRRQSHQMTKHLMLRHKAPVR